MPAPTPPPASPPADLRPAEALPLRELLAEDFATHDRRFVEPGFWALAVHRLGSRLGRVKPAVWRRPLAVGCRLLSTTVDWVWGIKLPPGTRVGRRLRIWHHGAILLNARSIGDDVHIRHATTVSSVRMAEAECPEKLPVIEDGVDIGSGACVLGDVRLGKGAFVGANSVVLQEVPPGAVVLGVPARMIPK